MFVCFFEVAPTNRDHRLIIYFWKIYLIKYDCLHALTPNMFAPLCLDLAPRRPTVFVAAIVASPSTGTRGIVGGSVAGSQAGTPDTSPTVGRSGIGSRDGAK